LPRDAGALAETVQGLLSHQHIAPAYGVTLNRDQQAQSHVRAVEKILGDIVERNGQPLSTARATTERQVGVCRLFTLLHVEMLRTQGIPARARCGFGAYFERGKYLDHWVTEYWNEEKKRWVLFDSQIDNRQRELVSLPVARYNYNNGWISFCWRDLHPLEWQLASLHGQLRRFDRAPLTSGLSR
jgi:hypothetical protein